MPSLKTIWQREKKKVISNSWAFLTCHFLKLWTHQELSGILILFVRIHRGIPRVAARQGRGDGSSRAHLSRWRSGGGVGKRRWGGDQSEKKTAGGGGAREEEKKTVGREKERVAQGKGNVLEPNFPTRVLQVVRDSRDSKFAKRKSLCKNV